MQNSRQRQEQRQSNGRAISVTMTTVTENLPIVRTILKNSEGVMDLSGSFVRTELSRGKTMEEVKRYLLHRRDVVATDLNYQKMAKENAEVSGNSQAEGIHKRLVRDRRLELNWINECINELEAEV